MSAPVRIPVPLKAAAAAGPSRAAGSSSSNNNAGDERDGGRGEGSRRSGGTSSSSSSLFASASPGAAASPISVGYRGTPEVGSEDYEDYGGFGRRRESLIGPSLAAQTHTVIDTSRPDGPPRITSFVRFSQGFEWNPDIFLPTHSPLWGSGAGDRLERRRDDVVDVILSDEEAAGLLPQ